MYRLLALPLLPAAWLYDAATRVRNRLFDCGKLPMRRFPLPVIAVGNLSVGGTGKTPHTELLLRLLSPRLHTAVLSRGYGRKSRGYVRAVPQSGAGDVGDEPKQMSLKFPNVTVAVCADRCEGIDRLMAQTDPRVEAIVLDDAFQHRYVQAGLYVLLTDFARPYCADFVLPAGRLRESARGARRADIVVVTKCPPRLSRDEAERMARRLRLRDGQRLFFSAMAYAEPYPLFPDEAATAPEETGEGHAFVLTGIARPAPLIAHVGSDGTAVTALSFPDHHTFTPADVRRINETFAQMPPGARAVTTEKDAARLRDLRDHLSEPLRRRFVVQPVRPEMLFDQAKSFNETIYEYVTAHQRNRSVD